jgi:cold shock CspA family protein
MAKTSKSKASALVVVQETEDNSVSVEEAVPVQETVEVSAPVTNDLVTSGRVKWFNNKAGYGFITVNDCENNEERDIFAHHSEIRVDQTQYKYLVQGEYVEFILGTINRENKIDVHATHVRGINGGKLMCETRNEVRSQRTSAPPQARQQQQAARAPSQAAPRRAPQLDKSDQEEWMVVPRRRTETVTSKPRAQPRQRQPQIEIAK